MEWATVAVGAAVLNQDVLADAVAQTGKNG